MKKVYIDAGHGGTNPGATYGKRKESEDVFALAQTAADRLSAVPDVAVKLSRTADTDPELDARTKEANAWGADYFISIHRNAFKPNGASGIEAWIYSKAAVNGDAYGIRRNASSTRCAPSQGLITGGLSSARRSTGITRSTVIQK